MSSLPNSPNTSIVYFLKKYGQKAVPLDFVAQGIGRRTPEILDFVTNLEKQGVVKLEGGTVRLIVDP